MSLLFDRYDSAALIGFLEEAGVLESLRAKGFAHFALSIDNAGTALPRIVLRADKGGRPHLLLESCLRRITVAAAAAYHGFAIDRPLDLLLVHWMREQDPTAPFAPDHPPLLLQRHPGLGVLRRAFRVAVRIATDLGVDGVASVPKFFHDAVIFHRSRLFLFLDGDEQGRFEALERDLETLKLRDATIAVSGWCVRDQEDRIVHWHPGYQVFPISPRLGTHFHSADYAAAVAAARERWIFRVDPAALATACALLDARAAPEHSTAQCECTGGQSNELGKSLGARAARPQGLRSRPENGAQARFARLAGGPPALPAGRTRETPR